MMFKLSGLTVPILAVVLTVVLAVLLLPIPLGAQDGSQETSLQEAAAQEAAAQEAAAHETAAGEKAASEETMQSEPGSLEARVVREIEELHLFFQAWFNGTVEKTEAAYDRFAGVLHENFVIVSPSGGLQERSSLIEGLRAAHAPEDTQPVRVWVEQVEIRWHWPMPDGDVVLATYQEWLQRGETKRGRRSSAILRERKDAPNGLEWLHVHETWLPLEE